MDNNFLLNYSALSNANISAKAAGDGVSISGFVALYFLIVNRDLIVLLASDKFASLPVFKVSKEVKAPVDLSKSFEIAAGLLKSVKSYLIGWDFDFGNTTASKSGEQFKKELGLSILMGNSREYDLLLKCFTFLSQRFQLKHKMRHQSN